MKHLDLGEVDEKGRPFMRIVSDARYAWHIVEQERKELLAYGPTFPLHALLGRLLWLGWNATEDRDVFGIELHPKDFADLVSTDHGMHVYAELELSRRDGRTERLARRMRPKHHFYGAFCDVLLFKSLTPITDTTKEPE